MFKKLFLIPLLSIALVGCDTNDDGFYNETYIEAQNLVTIEIQPDYAVDDVLNVAALIPRYLQETNYSNLLDVRQSTGNAERFNFTFLLEKRMNDGTWQYVELGNRYVADQGTADSGSFINAILIYDTLMEHYFFRGGIRLTEPGEHRLSFGYNSSSTNKVEFRSESPGDNLRLNISSTTNNLDGNGYYTFMVN